MSTKAAKRLLAWYDNHARELPWRVGPHDRARGQNPDPYRVWLSEIMLQQTTVATVKSYFEKFTNLWPNVEALSLASEEDILKAWAGLGYYSRARNLKKCADVIVANHGGAFPANVDALRALPGIGDYTSAAIASIAFNISAPVVDGNVERVFTRLFAIDTPLPKAKAEIKAKVVDVLYKTRPGDFAQACMDLGATICTPKKPACMRCPLKQNCLAFEKYDPEKFPVKLPKKVKPKRLGAAFVLQNSKGEILLEKRESSGLLASMTQVPTTGWTSNKDGSHDTSEAPASLEWRNCGSIKHVFTHFELNLTVWFAQGSTPLKPNQWWSAAPEDEALPTVIKKALQKALNN